MNPLFQAYCRMYQFVFRVAMPFLPYTDPVIYHSLDEAVELLKTRRYDTALLVTDSGLRRAGLTAPLETLLQRNNIRCVVYDKTCANPTVQNVTEVKALYQQEHCQCLIAFGGGSSIDCAKVAGAWLTYPKRSLDQIKGLLKAWRKLPTFIAVPTTAGTGSEVTASAVITDSETKDKFTMHAFPIISSHAVLDPHVTRTLPPMVTATTGLDALTHAVEAYIGGTTNHETRTLALDATKLIFGNIVQAYQHGDDMTARENMLIAAHKAGLSFRKSYVGYVHAIAHSLGGYYNIPHGLANAVLLPLVLEDYGPCAHKKLHELGIAAGVTTAADSHEAGAEKFIQAIRDLNRQLDIPAYFPELQAKDIPRLAQHAAKEANPFYPVPRLMDAKELEHFYKKVCRSE